MKRFSVPLCLKRSLQHPLLSHEETCSLALRAQKGDEAALASLVSHNQRLVFSVAAYYLRHARSHDILDLMQEGSIGLMKAVRKFDPARGYALSTYAMKFIRFAIIEALNGNDRLVSQPRDLISHFRALDRATERLQKELGREPTEAEVVAAADLKTNRDPQSIVEVRSRTVVSIDAPVSPDDPASCTYGDLIGDDIGLPPDAIVLARDAAASRVERIRAVVQLAAEAPFEPHFKDVFFRHHGLEGRQETDFSTLARERGVSKQCIHQYVAKVWRAIAPVSDIRSSKELRAEIEAVRKLGELAHMPIAV